MASTVSEARLGVAIHVRDADGSDLTLQAEPGRTLMEALRDEGLALAAICSGAMSCGTCHVRIAADWIARVGMASADERDLLEIDPFYDPGRSRLSCQITVTPALDGLSLELGPS